MKTLASKQSTIEEIRQTRAAALRGGESPALTFDRETVTVIDGEPLESSKRDRQQFELKIEGNEGQEILVGDVKLTVDQLVSALEQLGDDVEDKAIADAAAAAEIAAQQAEPVG